MTTTTNNKMANVFTQTYEDDMPEYIYQFMIDQKDQQEDQKIKFN